MHDRASEKIAKTRLRQGETVLPEPRTRQGESLPEDLPEAASLCRFGHVRCLLPQTWIGLGGGVDRSIIARPRAGNRIFCDGDHGRLTYGRARLPRAGMWPTLLRNLKRA